MADTICPDNSTTCLLRALLNDNTSRLILEQLLETNDQYDWNPVTLGFTVAIGVLAFVVAVVTVFQGCLAAGPGRLKAGYQAIGPWYVHSDVSFSWYQLAARSRARTPYIDMKIYMDGLSDLDPTKPPQPSSYQKLRNQILFGFEESQLGNDPARYSASWANLLQQAFVTTPTEFPLRTYHTDYIEDSLRAAPATGTMKSIVFLATYVNDSCLIECPEESSRLYCVRGLSSDLISRDIETMGPAVAFMCFGSPHSPALYTGRLTPGRDDMIASFHLFNGRIPFGETKLTVLSANNHEEFTKTRRKLRGSVSQLRTPNGFFKTNACPILMALCIGDVVVRPRAFPKHSTRLTEAIAALVESSIWRYGLVNRFRLSFLNFANRVTGKDPLDQQNAWMFPARHREAPFLKLDSLWLSEQVLFSPSMRQRESYLAHKLQNVRVQKDHASWTSVPPVTILRKSLQWDAKIEVASIVYALTRSIARNSKYSPESPRQPGNQSILEEIRGDRLATDRNRILMQNEILCVDEWLRQQEENDPNVVMCALMVLMKISDTREGLPSSENEGNPHVPTKKHRKANLPPPVCLLSDKDRETAMNSAFVYVGQEDERKASSAGSLDDEENRIDDDLVSNAGTNPDAYGGKTKVDKTRAGDEFWDIVEVLRYRALLYAAMLELCADSSAFRGDYTDIAVKII